MAAGDKVQGPRTALWVPLHSSKDSWRRIRLSVEDYLKLQGRFRHLFEPTKQGEAIRRTQERVDHIGNR